MKGKKSFVLYSDYINVIEKLPDDKAGVLFKTLLRYVNDLNPVVDDLIIELAFDPIKNQLKRDLIKWNEKSGNTSKSGHLGGIKSGESRRKKRKIKEQNRKNEANEAFEANGSGSFENTGKQIEANASNSKQIEANASNSKLNKLELIDNQCDSDEANASNLPKIEAKPPIFEQCEENRSEIEANRTKSMPVKKDLPSDEEAKIEANASNLHKIEANASNSKRNEANASPLNDIGTKRTLQIRSETKHSLRFASNSKRNEAVTVTVTGTVKRDLSTDNSNLPQKSGFLPIEPDKTTYRECVEIYAEFFKSKTDLPIKMDGAEGKSLKNIISYLKTATKEKGTSPAEAWRFILSSFLKWDKFHQKQLTIKQINSNLPNILNSIKNGNEGYSLDQQFNSDFGSI
ncbi:MAG: hypothetical protein UT21_C0006G0032 [Candidatus Woesebacteria bacterium GW2011_GWA1_39_11b]|nr:MAG: hypothetical protein UT21_C0006G0032 [Candidatus Woesebacteria bacterium GW2011_GWA1_39_11b]